MGHPVACLRDVFLKMCISQTAYIIISGVNYTWATMYRDADYTENVVFEGARVMTANRLAKDGEQWMDIFKQFNRYLSPQRIR